ncbi:27154_t:CDS:1 [Dentiscutata erythropus]|uniref:27154_t:CDS:1 n=1 Tax=Dentiscutata erythropus TaxID=1348616 RepID=A0A9N9NWC9_9GLOM|nr:27154_t:CDS:1 [Dentiscutata erythropus]
MLKYKTFRPRIYRDKNGFISSILVRGNIAANFKFKKILEKSDKQIKASFASVILLNSEEKTEVVTFNLENVIYNKGKNLSVVTATKRIIKFPRRIREKMENLTLRLE